MWISNYDGQIKWFLQVNYSRLLNFKFSLYILNSKIIMKSLKKNFAGCV